MSSDDLSSLNLCNDFLGPMESYPKEDHLVSFHVIKLNSRL